MKCSHGDEGKGGERGVSKPKTVEVSADLLSTLTWKIPQYAQLLGHVLLRLVPDVLDSGGALWYIRSVKSSFAFACDVRRLTVAAT